MAERTKKINIRPLGHLGFIRSNTFRRPVAKCLTLLGPSINEYG